MLEMTSEKADSDFSKSSVREKSKNKFARCFLNNWFMIATILGVAVGFGIAFGVRATKPSEVTIIWISK